MRAKDLRKYKPLDITELSGSPWNTAEKVLGLNEEEKVIMAKPYDAVSPEYVENVVNQAMEVETARTEETYIKQEVIPEVITGSRVGVDGDYDMLEFVKSDTSTGEVVAMQKRYIKKVNGVSIISPLREDNIELPTEEDIEDAILSAMETETGRTESTYAKKSEVPDVDDYYNKSQVDEKVAGAESYADSIVEGLASETYVDDAIAAIPQVDLSGYAKTTAVTQDIQSAIASETARTESTYAKPSQIPSLDGYATEQYVDNAIADIPEVDLSGYAKTTAVTQDIQTAMAAETARTESTYLKEHQSLDNYYTKSQVDAEISGATEGLASEQYVDDAIAAIPATDLSDYYTKDEVDAEITGATQDLASTDYVDDAIAAIPQTDLSNYYTKGEVDSEITGATEGLASEQYVDNAIAAIPAVDLSAYAKTTAVTEDIQTAMAAETARTESTYLKEHQSLDNYYTKSEVDADFLSAATAVGNAIDAAVQGLASEDYVDNAVSGLASEDYVNNAVTSATQNLASESYVDAAVTAATQNLATEQYVDDAIAAIPEPDLSDYYTKEEVDAEITGATEDMATKTWVGQQGYLTQHQDLSDYAKTTAVTEDIASAMAAETARTENTYAKPSQIPSLAGYATEQYVDDAIASETARTESTYLKEHQDISGKLDKTDFDTYTGATETALAEKLDASAYTVDNAMSSASTNPVENRAIYAALNGESVQTQMEISSVDSSVMVVFEIENSDFSQSSQIQLNLKETNIPGYYAIPTKTVVDCATTVSSPYYFIVSYLYNYNNNNFYTPNQDVQITENNLGTNIPFPGYSGHLIYFTSDLDGTLEYYFVYNTDGNYGAIYKTLPSIETISDHKANVSDLPTAQDGSSFNQFVYNDSNASNKRVVTSVSPSVTQNISNTRQCRLVINTTFWGGGGSSTSQTNFMPGNECIDGVKTPRDSQVISKAEEALNGFTEQITLTLGSRSATETITIGTSLYLYETNNPRYLAIPTSEALVGSLQNVTLSGTTYYVQNPIGTDNNRPVIGKYQLGTTSGGFNFNKDVSGNTYIIIDRELLTLEMSDSLTITRAKRIQDAIPSLTGYATETWVQSQGYLTQHQDISGKLDKTEFDTYTGATASVLAGKADVADIPVVPTNVSAFNNDAGYLTQHQSLANYYTKSEIDDMIGDIESLLASI